MNAGESQFDGNTDRNNPVINWDPTLGVETKNGIVISPATTLDHEMEHACGFDKAKKALGEIKPGQVTRTDHGGKTVRVENPISTKKVDE